MVALVSRPENSRAYCGSGRRGGRQGSRPFVVTHLRCAPPCSTPSCDDESVPSMPGVTQPLSGPTLGALAKTCPPGMCGGRPGEPEAGLIRSLSATSSVTPHRIAPLALDLQAGPTLPVTFGGRQPCPCW